MVYSTLKLPELSTYEWSSKDSSKKLPVYNPATGKLITTVLVGDANSVEGAVARSQKAFELWRWRTPADRAAVLLKCADVLEAHNDELAELLCLENGKPMQDAKLLDLMFLPGTFRFFGSLIDKIPTQFYDKGPLYATVFREPHGVCTGILPFNWPPIHTGGKSAPCLAAGNSMILKPGEQAPLTVMRIVEILQTVLPKDLLQAIPGNGPEVPQALVAHPLVKMISFTGSTAAGKLVSQAAGAGLKHLATELGGKNAFLVFDDAYFDRAVRDALEGALFNKGEACTASSRLLVQESVHDRFVDALAQGFKKIKVGNGMEGDTHVGPCVSQVQQKRVLEYIRLGVEEGAEIVTQAAMPTDPALKDGYFVPPTLFKNVSRTMRIAKEEMFGPLVTVTKFKDEDEAVSIVNESPYGLTCIVHTKDMEKGMRVGRRVEAGAVMLNNNRRNFLGLPFGGVKESGNAREHCIETLNEWSSAKFIQMPSGIGQPTEWRAVSEIYGERQ